MADVRLGSKYILGGDRVLGYGHLAGFDAVAFGGCGSGLVWSIYEDE